MRLYLSGPITNEPNYRRNFAEAQRILESMGEDDIINPAELCKVLNIEKYSYKDIMEVCKGLLRTADVLILLPGHEHSHGCGIEEGIAEERDMHIMEFEDFVRR